MISICYRPQTKLREGNVLTPVCQSFFSQGGVHDRGCIWQGACVVGGMQGMWGMHRRGGLCLWGGGGRGAGEMATEGGGGHPTGMHFYCFFFFNAVH